MNAFWKAASWSALVLLDELVGDPDLLQPRERDQRGDDQAPEAVLGDRQERRDRDPLEEAEDADPDLEQRVDDRPPSRVLAQAAPLEREAVGQRLDRGVDGLVLDDARGGWRELRHGAR